MRRNLTPNTKTVRIANATAAGVTDINCDVLDMQGFRGVRAIALLGTLTATQVTKLIAYQSDTVDGTGDPFDKIGETVSALDADGNKILILEVCQPNKRYIRFVVDRGTANAVLDGVVAELYGASVAPVDPSTTVSAQAKYGSPNEYV